MEIWKLRLVPVIENGLLENDIHTIEEAIGLTEQDILERNLVKGEDTAITWVKTIAESYEKLKQHGVKYKGVGRAVPDELTPEEISSRCVLMRCASEIYHDKHLGNFVENIQWATIRWKEKLEQEGMPLKPLQEHGIQYRLKHVPAREKPPRGAVAVRKNRDCPYVYERKENYKRHGYLPSGVRIRNGKYIAIARHGGTGKRQYTVISRHPLTDQGLIDARKAVENYRAYRDQQRGAI